MKILSCRQPWVWMMFFLGKRIENRKKPILRGYRGPLLIHASAWKSTSSEMKYYDEAWMWVAAQLGIKVALKIPRPKLLEYGGIVGVVELTGAFLLPGYPPSSDLWWMPDQFGYIFCNTRTLPFTPWKGALVPQVAPKSLLPLLGKAAQHDNQTK